MSGSAAGRKDRRGRLTLSGNNGGLVGQFNVMDGVVAMRNTLALGGQAADKVVNAGAAVEIELSQLPPLSTIQEAWVLNGTGFGNDNSGALRVFSTVVGGGQVNLLGTITIASNNTVIGIGSMVPAGVANASLSEAINSPTSGSSLDQVNFNGVLNFGTNLNTVKVGSGTLELDGIASNAGSGGTFFLNDGTVIANKTGAAQAMPINLVVGDNDSGAPANAADSKGDKFIYFDGSAGTDQIGGVNVTVGRTGLIDFNSRTDTVGGVTIVGGKITGTTGTMTASMRRTTRKTRILVRDRDRDRTTAILARCLRSAERSARRVPDARARNTAASTGPSAMAIPPARRPSPARPISRHPI
jgi:hypothetical protein